MIITLSLLGHGMIIRVSDSRARWTHPDQKHFSPRGNKAMLSASDSSARLLEMPYSPKTRP